MHASYAMPGRRAAKRVKNRLAKKGLTFLRFEQGDRALVTMRVILETRRAPVLGRAFTYPHAWLLAASPRLIADSVLADYAKGYGHVPRAY